MARPKTEMKLYNKPIEGILPNLKEDFIKGYDVASQENYRRILSQAYDVEEMLNKDIYEFSLAEIKSLLMTYRNTSVVAVYTIISCLRGYIDYCIHVKRVSQTRINYLIGLSGEEDMKEFVNQFASKSRILNRNEINQIQNKLINPRDKLLIELFFIGLKGRSVSGATYEEIINLKESDVDFVNKTLKITRNNGDFRIIYVSDYTLDLIKDTIQEDFYFHKNDKILGDFSQLDNKGFGMNNLPKSENIIRQTKSTGKIQASFISNLFVDIKKWVEIVYFTPTTIQQSGMVHMANMIMVGKGIKANELTDEDFTKIGIQFGLPTSKMELYPLKKKIKPYLK